jgi:uncharacterized protein YeeX (DUF496 family)
MKRQLQAGQNTNLNGYNKVHLHFELISGAIIALVGQYETKNNNYRLRSLNSEKNERTINLTN